MAFFEEAGERFHAPALRSFNRRSAPTFDLRDRLHRIRAATLVLAGERDPLGTFASTEIAEAIGDARLVVLKEVGHFPSFEDADGFRAAVLPFLQDA